MGTAQRVFQQGSGFVIAPGGEEGDGGGPRGCKGLLFAPPFFGEGEGGSSVILHPNSPSPRAGVARRKSPAIDTCCRLSALLIN